MKKLLALLALTACATKPDLPTVQESAPAEVAAKVEIGSEGIGTPCLVIDVGETVEWRNLNPGVPANVTGLGNTELYSPSIVTGGPSGSEYHAKSKKTFHFAYWRHTFSKRGVFEYYDTNRGDPGQKVVDPYYGTISYAGTSASLQTGVVCVQDPGSSQCTAVCCIKNNDGDAVLAQNECTPSQCCDPKGKRCLEGAPTAPVCAPGIGSVKQAAFRNFACFADSDCAAGSDGKPKVCAVDNQDSHVCRAQ